MNEVEGVIETLKTSLKKAIEPVCNTNIEDTIIGINELMTSSNEGADTIINEELVIAEPVLIELDVENGVGLEVLEEVSMPSNSENCNLSLNDIIKMGKDKMKEFDIATHRKNVREMRNCHDKFLSNAFDKLVNQTSNNDVVHFEEIQQLNKSIVSSFIIDFNNLKMRQNRSTNFISRFQGLTNGL